MDKPLSKEGEETERAYQVLMTAYREALQEENRLVSLFAIALASLAAEDSVWSSNKIRYKYWDFDRRIIWIYRIQEQAEQGLPMAQQLMAKVLAVRMTL